MHSYDQVNRDGPLKYHSQAKSTFSEEWQAQAHHHRKLDDFW
jgi:hypothetical protein